VLLAVVTAAADLLFGVLVAVDLAQEAEQAEALGTRKPWERDWSAPVQP
jgi:hypothetical protein